MEIDELLQMAESISALPDGDEQTAVIEQYVDAFGEWFKLNEPLFRAGGGAAGMQPAELKRVEALAASHAEVMRRVERLLGETSLKLGSLHKKAKGIMAYTDFLPKRISVARARKG